MNDQDNRSSEKNYRQLVELAQEGIWRIDAAASITYVNQRMAERSNSWKAFYPLWVL